MPWLAPEQIARLIFNFFHFSKLSLKYRSQSLYKRKEKRLAISFDTQRHSLHITPVIFSRTCPQSRSDKAHINIPGSAAV